MTWCIIVLSFLSLDAAVKDRQILKLTEVKYGTIEHCVDQGEKISTIFRTVLDGNYIVWFRCDAVDPPKGWPAKR